ncbi:MAG: mechanosensitive ion channel family protein [Alkalispirochaeta sp.]
MIDILLEYGGTLGTALGAILVIGVGRFILARSVTDKRSLPYHRQILTLGAAVVGLFLAVAFLPVSPEIRGQILSVMGVLLSAAIALSSTTFVGNAMAGIMLRVTRGFRAGDFIRFQSVVGRVADLSLFHTEIQLITRDIVTVPNVLLTQNAVHVTRRGGTFVNVDVSIGYTVAHETVIAALKEAAEQVELNEPFVLVEELLDHAIRYRVYGLLDDSSALLTATSDLRRAILTTLHRQAIEIASPSLTDRRSSDSSAAYVPPPIPSDEAPDAESDNHPAGGDDETDIEAIAFDRAEQAESIESLYALQEKLEAELKSLGDTDEPGDRKKRLKAHIKYVATEISRREEQKEEQRRDESTQN